MTLCALSDVEPLLNLTAGDPAEPLLTALIGQASAWIEAICGRVFEQATYSESYDGNGNARLLLRNTPVVSVASVMVGSLVIPQAVPANGSVVGQPGWRATDRAVLLSGYCFERGQDNVSVTYTAGYATIPADLTLACAELVALSFRGLDHLGQNSKNLGGVTVSFRMDELSPRGQRTLNSWRRVAPL